MNLRIQCTIERAFTMERKSARSPAQLTHAIRSAGVLARLVSLLAATLPCQDPIMEPNTERNLNVFHQAAKKLNISLTATDVSPYLTLGECLHAPQIGCDINDAEKEDA